MRYLKYITVSLIICISVELRDSKFDSYLYYSPTIIALHKVANIIFKLPSALRYHLKVVLLFQLILLHFVLATYTQLILLVCVAHTMRRLEKV